MEKIIGLIIGLAIFALWMNVVGNPHVVETVIGLLLAIIGAFLTFRQIRRLIRNWKSRA